MLGLQCCTQALSGCGWQGLLSVGMHGVLIAVEPHIAEHRLLGEGASAVSAWGLSNCGMQALELQLIAVALWAPLFQGM